MIQLPFTTSTKSCLGIDIGTSSIKVIELSRRGETTKLEKYGEISSAAIYEKPFRTFERDALLLSGHEISRAITAILKEARISEKKAVFSIPDFSSFFTTFDLPSMTSEEIPQAVKFEARHHIPLPLSEVNIDWSTIKKEAVGQDRVKLKILLVAVPNEVINQYQQIAVFSNLQLLALEAEVFGLIKSLLKGSEETIVLLDIGAQSSNLSIVDEGVLKSSYSFDVSSSEMIQILSKSFKVDFQMAENLLKLYGIVPVDKMVDKEIKHPSSVAPQKIKEILAPLVDLMLIEIKRISQSFYQSDRKEIKRIILAGGLSLLPGLKEYLSQSLNKNVEIANPFSGVSYPPILEQNLRVMGPSYAIALGMALRGLELK
jgi:type IV pilus assembly protein PilM